MSRPVGTILALALLLCLAVLRWLDLHPITLPAVEREAAPSWQLADQDADVGLIAAAANGGLNWLNTLQQEFGPVAVRERLPSARWWQRRSVVVLAAPVETAPVRLRGFVERGGVLVVDALANGPAAALFASHGERRQAVRITDIRSPGDVSFDARSLLAAPLFGERTPWLRRAGDDMHIWLQIDHQPAVVARANRHGGGVVLIGFDFPHTLQTIQQGRPGFGDQVINRYPDLLRPELKTTDLVCRRDLLRSSVPYADLLERWFAALVRSLRPLPRWWLHPNARSGAFVMTHDDERFGDKSRWMTEYERDIGATSTVLFIPSDAVTAGGLRAIRDDGAELGIHWDFSGENDALSQPLGFWRVQPFRRIASLSQQMALLEAKLPPGTKLTSCRTHYLLWTLKATRAVRIMEAAGIGIDSSYGVDFGTQGYLFGTGLPFHPLDVDRTPFRLLELPHHLAEDLAPNQAPFLRRLVTDSASRYHTIVVPLFHPSDMAWRPSVELYQLWKSSYRLAQEAGLWVTRLRDVELFWRARESSLIHSRWSESGTLTITAEPRRDGLTLAVPRRWRGSDLNSLRVDGQSKPPSMLSVLEGDVMVVLSAGKHELECSYEPNE